MEPAPALSPTTRMESRGEPALPGYHVIAEHGTSMGPATVSIVVPAYNEALRLPLAIPRLRDAVADQSWEIVLVDDGSTDATVAVAVELLAGLPRARVLRLDRHRGKGAAVRAGVAVATGDRIVFMDADMSTDLQHLPEVVAHLDDHDVLIGSRYAPGASATGLTPWRRQVSLLFLTLSRTTMGMPLSDFQCGFKGFRAPVARVAFHLLKEDGWAFDVELLALADAIGASIHEVPVRWSAVPGGHLRMISDSARMWRDLRRIRRMHGRSASLYLLELHDTPLGDALPELLAEVAPAPVVAARGSDVLVFLPFADRAAADRIAEHLGRRFPAAQSQLRLVGVEALLAPEMQPERTALLSAWSRRA